MARDWLHVTYINVTVLGFPGLDRRFEPLISDSAVDGEEEAGGGDGDKLAVWWQYIQAVQDGLPNDLQVRVDRDCSYGVCE